MVATIKGGEQIWFLRTSAPLMYCIVSAEMTCRLTTRTVAVLLCYSVPMMVLILDRRMMRLLGDMLLVSGLLLVSGGVLLNAIRMLVFAILAVFVPRVMLVTCVCRRVIVGLFVVLAARVPIRVRRLVICRL